MLPFVIMLLVPMAIQHVGANDDNFQKKNRSAIVFFFAILTFLVACRHRTVGNDTANYIYFFENFVTTSWEKLPSIPLEIGFSYFNKIVSVFSVTPQVYLAVAGILVSALILPTYRRLSADPFLTIVLFCTMSIFFMMFSGIRQMIAVGIGFIAYEFVRRKKLILFILTVALAMMFHTSAFMLAFMYPLYYARITPKWMLIVVPVLTVIFIFNETIFTVLAIVVERFTGYEGGISATGAYMMLILFAVFAVFAFLIPDENVVDRETNGLRNFLLLAVVLQMFAPLHTLAMRMNYYYIVFIPLLLPRIISCRSARWDQVAIVARHVMVIFFLVYFFINAKNGESNLNVFPYHFFWENGV